MGISPAIVAGGVGVALLLMVGLARLRRRPSREEVRLVRVVVSVLFCVCRATLDRLDGLVESGALGRAIGAAEDEARTQVSERRAALNERVHEAVDNDLFVAALKSRLPKDSWKQEFDDRLEGAAEQVLQPAALQAAVQGAVVEQWSGLFGAASPPGSASGCQESAHALDAIPPARLQRFMQGQEDLQVRLDQLTTARQGVAFGVVLSGAGGAVWAAGTFLPHDALVWVSAKAMKSALHVNGMVATVAMDWISEQVGEEVLDEALEAIGAALTGVGLLFTGWKLAKYAWLVKRLTVDQEHLVTLREQLGDTWLQTLDGLERDISRDVAGQIRTGFDGFRAEIAALFDDTQAQLDWADAWD